MNKKMFFCKRCLQPSTRPRIGFKDGICNACHHHDWKQKQIKENILQSFGPPDGIWLNWVILADLCGLFKRHDGWFDVIVPCSGGKDGSYVAWKLKHEFNMNVLAISCPPLIPTRIGKQNLENFLNSGFDHIAINVNREQLRLASRRGFIEQGRPWHAFDTVISTSIFQLALKLDIPFIMYGEEGESEYGGASDAKMKIDREYLLNYYYCGHDPSSYGLWWKMPSQEDLNKLYATHWSKFEDWDPQVHARHAKEHCGLELLVGGSIGTFTNYASLDDLTRDLHVYLQYVKFGFGRCVADASVEIRRGRMTREQGVEVCRKVDGAFPVEVLPAYLDYYEMSEGEFWELIDKWVDYRIMRKTGKVEKPYELKRKYRGYNVYE